MSTPVADFKPNEYGKKTKPKVIGKLSVLFYI